MSRRLLIVTESLGVGGTESHLLRTLPRLAARGWEIAVFCLARGGEGAASMQAGGVEVLAPAVEASRNQPFLYSANLLFVARRLYKFLRRWRPDIVHFYLPRPYLVGAPTALAAGVPVKIMSRRSLSHYQRSWPTAARIERQLHRKMDVLIGNSAAVVRDLLAEGAAEEKVRLIYNGVEPAEPLSRDEARRALGLDDETLVGLVVANLIHYKGHRDLIAGLAEIASEMPDAWRILLAGRDEGLRQQLDSAIKKRGLAGKVQFLGQRSDVATLLAAADFGVLPSREEGFSNVVLESMVAGLPMIVTEVGGNPEAVLDGETGLVVPPSDPQAIGAAILRFARDPDLRRRYGAAARRRAKQEFSLDRCVTLHAALYEELLEKTQSRDLSVPNSVRSSAAPAIVPERKRPLMLAYWGRYGGLPQFTLELADACQKLGRLDRTTISISSSNELFERYGRFGTAILPVQTYQSGVAALNLRGLMKLQRSIEKRLFADDTKAFVTLMSHVWSPMLKPVLSRAGVRHTVIVHDADPHGGDPTARLNRWLLQEARAADAVVTLTEHVAERLISTKLIPEKKVSVLFHPDLIYQPETYGEPQTGPLRVLFFGRILPYKGLSIFVDALELLRRAGVPVQVGVFGQGELGTERVRLKALGAEIRNEWIPPEVIPEIFGRYDVLVVSHTKASQSGVIAAAHGAALPVISTPVGGLTEQIRPDFTGIIAEAATGDALAVAIRRVAEDRPLLQRMRRNIDASRIDRSMERFVAELSEIALGSSGRRP